MSDLTDPLAGNRMQAPQVADQQPDAPLSPPAWLERLPSNDNPFAKMLREDPASGSVSLAERSRLNLQDEFYRNTLRGRGQLQTFEGIANGQEPPNDATGRPDPTYLGMTPEEAGAKADSIRRDLARYEALPGFQGPLEGTAAFAGQIGGGLLSPENWIARFPGAAWAVGKVVGEAAPAVARRILEAAMSQGLLNVTVDPLQQAGSISADLQDGWDPVRSAWSFPLGAAMGGILHGAGEAAGAVAGYVRQRAADLAESVGFAPTAQRVARERLYPPQPGEQMPAPAPSPGDEISWMRVEDPSFQSFPTDGRPAETAPPPTAAAEPGRYVHTVDGETYVTQSPTPPTPEQIAQLDEQQARLTKSVEMLRQNAPQLPEQREAVSPARGAAEALPAAAAAPTIPDPLDLMRLGELTAARAEQIRDELVRASPEELKTAAPGGATDHLDPEMWKVIADNLAKAEASREGGVSVVADQMRYMPADGVPKTISHREAVAVIARALDAEAARGGDVRSLLAEADAAYRAAGHGTPPDISAAEAARAAPAAPSPPAPLEGGIAGDVARQLIAAGRPEAEARARGALQQTLYETHAARFEGRLGSAEDIYRREGAQIVGGEAGGELQPGELGQGPRRYVERDGERFVARANGSDVLGEITPQIGAAIGREAGPIRLAFGTKRYGEQHIEAGRQAALIRAAGYPDAASFVNDIASDFTGIYQARDGRLILTKPNGLTHVAIIELRPSADGSHWTVTTAGLYRPSYFRNQKLLWRRSEPVTAPEGASPSTQGQSQRSIEPPGEPSKPELAQAGRGKIRLATDDANALITLFRNAADASSAGHELAHDWLERLVRDAARPEAPREFVNDVNNVLRPWLGNDGGPLTTAQHEKFATGWEQYERTGRAPTRQLEGIFAQFREWLLKIYRTITDLGEPLTPEMQGFFDRLHAIPEKRAAGEARLAQGLVGEPVPNMPAHRVATAGGDSVEVAPIVVEARDLIASNDPGYDPALQPRQREDRAAAQQQVREMASRLDPERLGASSEADRGAPIIGDDGMVESGNGRLMAIRAAYDADGPAAAAYREFLTRQGVDVAGYDQPVLVRQRTTPMSPKERADFAVDANRAATLQLSAPERAMADARNLTPDMLDLIRNPDNLEAVQNRDFVRAFVESLPQAEQGAMTTAEGGLSAEGLTRIRHAILARAYGGTADGAAILARITESTQDEIRSISNALTAAAPQWSRLRADIEAGRVVPEVDLTPELLEAVRRTADLRNRGQSFSDFLRQRDAFDALPPRVEAFMSLFYDAKGTRAAGGPRIADALREYANEASKVSAEPGLDLGLPAVSADDIQRRIAERARGGGDTGTLFGRERPDQRAGGAGAVAGGAERGAQVQRRGAGEPGAGAGAAVQPGPRGGVIYTGRERPAATARAAAGAGTGAGGVSGRVPVRGTPSPAGGGAAGEAAVRTLHQQAFDLADAIGFPLRQGRMHKPTFAGQYDSAQDVARARAVADFGTVAHEAGHAIEKHVGSDLTDLTNRFATELSRLDYDPQLARVNEGFAEWLRHYLTSAPGYAESLAPTFSPEFRTFMRAKAPAVLDELDRARGAYQAYMNAPTGQKLDAIVQRSEPEGVLHTIRTEGMPRTISLVLAKGYQGIFDDKAPVARAVRDLARLYRDASGNRMNLEGSDNPELQVRMFARSHQAAVGDMMDGVRPYHAIEPRGPSLRDALIKASGEPGIFGRWDSPKVKEFDNYLVARRSEVLWAKYNAGQLPRRPLAMSEGEVKTAIAEAEAANPSFAAAARMVHDYTRELLTKQYTAGLIDRELYEKLTKEPFYVPLYRRMDDKPMLAGDRPTAGGAEGPGMVDLIRRQTGSDRDIISPIQGVMTQTFLVERTVAHNDIIKSFDALAQQARSAGATGVGRIVERVPAHEIKATKFNLAEGIENAARQAGIDPDDTKVLMGAIADTFGEDPIMASVFRRQPTGARGEPIVFYKDGGQLKALRFIADDEGRALYETLTSLPPVIRDWAIGLGAASATALRTGIVANPVFALTNFVRDQLAAAILRPGTIPFNPRGLFRELSGDRYAQMYSAAGGVSPGAQAVGLTEMLVDRSIDELARKGWAVQKVGAIGDLVTRGKVLGALKAVGETVELGEAGTRLNVMKSVFEQKKRQGLSDYDAMLEAAYQATDMLDFGRHGSGTQLIRTLVPFINAHMQALDKASRTLFQPLWRAARGDLVTQADVNAVKNAALSWGLIGVSAGLGVAYATWAASHEAYHDANDELRATHLIIPGDAFGYPGKILLAPKPFELAIGFNLGEMLGLGIATGDPRLAGFAIGGVQEVLVPPNVLNSIPVLKTYAELALNRSFFTRRDIVPQRLQALTPAEQVIPGQTSTMARTVGRALGISPIKIDYAIGNTFGLWGKDLLALSNTADPDAAAPALENQMFLRRFIKGADVASETTKRFWALAGAQTGEYAQAKNTYDSMIRDFREKDAAAFLAALPAPERVYVTLQSSGDENGRAVFNADEKRMHPLTRAAEAVLTNSAYIRELSGNTQQSIETQERLALDPQHRRQVIDALRVLSAMEQRNALVIAAEPGYAGRNLLSAEDQFRVIQAISPEAADEVAARYAAAKIPPTAMIAQAWPEAQKRLLAEGSEAELRDLSSDVRGEGYAFEADRVKKAPKRRLPIAPAPTPALPLALPPMSAPQQPAASASP